MIAEHLAVVAREDDDRVVGLTATPSRASSTVPIAWSINVIAPYSLAAASRKISSVGENGSTANGGGSWPRVRPETLQVRQRRLVVVVEGRRQRHVGRVVHVVVLARRAEGMVRDRETSTAGTTARRQPAASFDERGAALADKRRRIQLDGQRALPDLPPAGVGLRRVLRALQRGGVVTPLSSSQRQ